MIALKRLYISNYRSLVNFEVTPDDISLFCGPNGSGKSTVFEMLSLIQQMVANTLPIKELFPTSSLTRWQRVTLQKFEIDLQVEEMLFRYVLEIEHDIDQGDEGRSRVKSETLNVGEKPLFEFVNGDVQLYRDNYSKGPTYTFDWGLSALAFVGERKDNRSLVAFRDALKRIFVLKPIPKLIVGYSERETSITNQSMENFVSWYRTLSEDQRFVFSLRDHLVGVFENFENFRFERIGKEGRQLKVTFKGSSQSVEFDFDELSDGQKMLIALYTLLTYAETQGLVLCIDEPQNYVAPPEIQPWLLALYDLCREGKCQAIVISHHPEFLNYLIPDGKGYWFERDSTGPTRVRKLRFDQEDGLPVAELVARGWFPDD
jgi:predicted ATPase